MKHGSSPLLVAFVRVTDWRSHLGVHWSATIRAKVGDDLQQADATKTLTAGEAAALNRLERDAYADGHRFQYRPGRKTSRFVTRTGALAAAIETARHTWPVDLVMLGRYASALPGYVLWTTPGLDRIRRDAARARALIALNADAWIHHEAELNRIADRWARVTYAPEAT